MQLNNAKFVLYETRVHGKADRLKRFGDNIIRLENSEVSSCEPGDDAWVIKGSAITINHAEHYGTAENMRLMLKDVPVLYSPYVRFPVGNERLTGFFFPSLSFPEGNNIDTSVPFYWNIAPNYDATITPRYISDRGTIVGTEFRHLSEHFETTLGGSSLGNDKIYVDEDGRSRQDRWFGNITQVGGGKGEVWSTLINYSDISDKDYHRDINNTSVDANRQAYLHQLASVDYRTDRWFVGAKVDEYRLLTTTQLPYRELPRVHIDGNFPLLNDWSLSLENEYVNFVKNRYLNDQTSSADINSIIFGERITTDYSLAWNKSVNWGFLRPRLGVKSLNYNLESKALLPEAGESPKFVVPQFSVDTGLYFDRSTTFFDSEYLQTLEPRAFYFYSGYKNQAELYNLTASAKKPSNSFVNFDTSELTFNYNQLFRTTRFAGGDRLDDANQITLALSSAIVSPRSGIERLRISIGQIFYANDRRVTVYDSQLKENIDLVQANKRTSSDVVVQIGSQIGQDMHVSTDIAYDQHQGFIDNASTGIHYVNDNYNLFNLVYRYSRKPVMSSPSQPVPLSNNAFNQIDVSTLWPVNSRWSAIARSNYDFHYGVELDTFAGLEYNDCCYRVRLLYRRWLDVNYSDPNYLQNVTRKDYRSMPMLDIEFKGLGGVDQRLSSLLDKAIAGFGDREKKLR